LRFLDFPSEIRRFLYTTNQLERLFKEIKRRLKVMEILPREENAENILYLILYDLNEKLFQRKLPGFESAFSETHHPTAQEVKR
jgi:transposase-like protein